MKKSGGENRAAKNSVLPPLIDGSDDGFVIWRNLEHIDYDTLGYFLSCHLIIEHYLDEYLKVNYTDLDWQSTRLTFNNKVTLISKLVINSSDHIPAIKHLNGLRNKLSHDIRFDLKTADLIPLQKVLKEIGEAEAVIPTEPRQILEVFTRHVCSFLGGFVAGRTHYKRFPTRVDKSVRDELAEKAFAAFKGYDE